MIPLLDLVAQYHTIKPEIDAAIQSVLESGRFILGPHEKAFEEEVAAYLGVKHAIGVASGTDALVISLRAAGIGHGDEVIIPAYSFFATAGCVLSVGAKPVFVDIDPRTYLIDTFQIEEIVTSKTKAIIPVHLYGQPADMDEIQAIALKYQLRVIEDNAQAFGADYKGKKTGSIGDLGCLSFFPSKNLGGYGDGGMVTTNDDVLAEQVRMLRVHGWKKKYFPEMLGYNSRLDEIQASVLRVKLKHVDQWNTRRIELAQLYSATLNKIGIQVPTEAPQRKHVYHLFVVQTTNRTELKQKLQEKGIASEIYYPQPLHFTAPYQNMGGVASTFLVSEQASRETLAIPLYPELSTKQIDQILQAVIQSVF